jgi:hypothetical protein
MFFAASLPYLRAAQRVLTVLLVVVGVIVAAHFLTVDVR